MDVWGLEVDTRFAGRELCSLRLIYGSTIDSGNAV